MAATINPDASEAIGTVTYTHVSEPVSLRQVREYVVGTGDDLETWSDAEGAKTTPVPPLFFHAACRPIVAEKDLRPDGQYQFLGFDGVSGSTVAGGQRFDIIAPVYLGDVISVEERLVAIEEKVGRSGPIVITSTMGEYRNQLGVLVAKYRQTIIFR